jgi:hypothetical protein
MSLLKEAPLDSCFYLGWNFGRIDSSIGFRSFPQTADQLDWRTDREVYFPVAMWVSDVSRILEVHVLSIPVSRRLERLKKLPRDSRSLADELRHRLVAIDLTRSHERARWLQAGWLLQRLEMLDSTADRVQYERSQIPDIDAWAAEVTRNAATALAPDSPARVAKELRRIRKQFGSDWFNVVASRAADQAIAASSTPIVGEVRSSMVTAWSPQRVFLSHSSKDKPIVRRIHQALHAQVTIDAFLDERELRVGDQLDPVLEKAIAESDYLLAILSASSYASHWFWKEFEFAKQHHVPILPLRIDDADVPSALSGIVYDDLREGFAAGLERVVYSMTNNPALPFLKHDQQSHLVISLEMTQAVGSKRGGKFADMTIRLRAEKAYVVKSLSLTTLGQWDMVQPDSDTTTEPVTVPEGIAAEIRAASESKVTVPLSLTVESESSTALTCRFFTRYDRGNGLGRYLYLVGAELVLGDFRSVNLGCLLADLHGRRVLGYTRGYGSQADYEEAQEIAEEIQRVTPSSCVMDPVVLRNLREIAEDHNLEV